MSELDGIGRKFPSFSFACKGLTQAHLFVESFEIEGPSVFFSTIDDFSVLRQDLLYFI